MKKPVKRKLFLILLLGFVLFSSHLDWGLPRALNPDQGVAAIMKFGQIKSVNLKDFKKPQFLRILYAIPLAPYLGYVYFANPEIRKVRTFEEIPKDVFSTALLIARSLSVLFALGSVLMIFWITRRLVKKDNTALFIAFLSVLNIDFINHAHFATGTISSVFFSLLVYHFGINIIEHGKRKDYVVAAIFTAMASSVKYTGLILGLYLAICHFLFIYKKEQKVTDSVKKFISNNFVIMIAVVIVTFLIINPSVLFELEIFKADISQRINTRYGWGDRYYEGFVLPFYFNAMINSFGLPLFILMVLSFLYLLFKKDNDYARIALLAFTIIAMLNFGIAHFMVNRFMISIIPIFYILFGMSLEKFLSIKVLSRKAALIILSVVTLYSIIYGIVGMMSFSQDARYDAEAWIENNIPEQSSIMIFGIDRLSPAIDENKFEVVHHKWVQDSYPQIKECVEAYCVQYIIVSSLHYNDFIPRDRKFGDYFINYESSTKIPEIYELIFSEKNYEIVYDYRYELAYFYPRMDLVNPRIVIFKAKHKSTDDGTIKAKINNAEIVSKGHFINS